MVVTLGITELVAALRLSDSPEELAEATRLLEYATEAVTKHVPTAPDAIHNEAVRRLAGYLYDQPEASRGDAYSNALRNSGAARILLPYRVHRAGYSDAMESAQAAVGSVGNPVTGLAVNGLELVVTFEDGTSEVLDLPSGGMETPHVDQTARDSAAAAQTEVDTHETSTHNTDTTARADAATAQSEIDTHEASTHNTDVTARTAAATAQGEIDTHEASTHNTDTAARSAAAAAQGEIDTHKANHPAGGGGGAMRLVQTRLQIGTVDLSSSAITALILDEPIVAGVDYEIIAFTGSGTTKTIVGYRIFSGSAFVVDIDNGHLADPPTATTRSMRTVVTNSTTGVTGHQGANMNLWRGVASDSDIWVNVSRGSVTIVINKMVNSIVLV